MATKAKKSARTVLLELLNTGKKITLAQMQAKIKKVTGKQLTSGSLYVYLSNFRRLDGLNIVSFKGSNSTARDGSTQYLLS
jgi:hypothetical protein